MSHRFSPRQFGRDTGAASAVEFALLAPLMLFILLGTFEITRAFSVKRKVEELATTVTRFVTRTDRVTQADLASFVTASTAVMFPNATDNSVLKIIVQRIDRKDDGAVVVWSYDWNARKGTSPGSASPFVPTEPSVIRTNVTYTHKVTFTSMLSSLNLSEFELTASQQFVPDKLSPITSSGF